MGMDKRDHRQGVRGGGGGGWGGKGAKVILGLIGPPDQQQPFSLNAFDWRGTQTLSDRFASLEPRSPSFNFISNFQYSSSRDEIKNLNTSIPIGPIDLAIHPSINMPLPCPILPCATPALPLLRAATLAFSSSYQGSTSCSFSLLWMMICVEGKR